MDREKIPNNTLRRERQLRGWSQRKVAEFVDTSEDVISRWERGESKPSPFFQEKLCTLYGKSAEELGIFAHDQEEKSERYGNTKILETTKEPSVFSLPTVFVISQQEIDKAIDQFLAQKVIRFHNWLIDGLEEGTQLRWHLYYTSRNSLTEKGLQRQIERLEQLANDGGEHRQRICRLLAQNYQLAGNLNRDKFQYTKSINFFQKAERLHEDTQLPDLTAAAITRQAIALLRKNPEQHLNTVLALYCRAVNTMEHAESYTQVYVLSRYAEALARKGNYDECIESLDRAETLLNYAAHIPIEEDFAYTHLTLQSLADSRGECYVLLGKPQKGLEQLQAAQKNLNQKMSRNNCRLLMLQSEAYLVAGNPEACVEQALKGLNIARILESTSNIHWAYEILTKIRSSAFGNEPVIMRLQEAIQDQKR